MSHQASRNMVLGALGMSLVMLAYSFLTGEATIIAAAGALVAIAIAFWLQ